MIPEKPEELMDTTDIGTKKRNQTGRRRRPKATAHENEAVQKSNGTWLPQKQETAARSSLKPGADHQGKREGNVAHNKMP